MGILGIFSGPAKSVPANSDVKQSSPDPEPAIASNTVPSEAEPAPPSESSKPVSSAAPDVPVGAKVEETAAPKAPARRLSFRPFASASSKQEQHKPILSEAREHEKKASAANAFSKRWAKPLSSNSDKRAKESALIVRTLIVGPPSNNFAAPTLTKAVATPQLSKVKSQLMQPNSANKVIAQLRALPVIEAGDTKETPHGPIHAVCLARPDADENELYFAKLTPDAHVQSSRFVPNVASASLDKLTGMFSEMHIVNLVTAQDLGIGQPGDGPGLLAGAVPTAETVINGIEQITPQLMALGYATGKAVLPDHKGVHPPLDRISVLTYWWGLEVVLPEPTMQYLSSTQSIAGTLVNFLTALSLMNNGVREILPFVRYISQFIDFEFKTIKSQDQGQGVVCAATWIMPAALVPRPWDFPPPDKTAAAAASSEEEANPDSNGGELDPDVLNPPISIPDPAVVQASPSPPSSDTAVVSAPPRSPPQRLKLLYLLLGLPLV
ncbi:Lactamase-B domain-containing protein [Mycena venus]|uniref:Lactamase-B domain-containing protein n=1 Tax=Mycena venus TaxID=2733690 RepID=A0A8H6YIM4_9AGAR|nr:Lactamase-B domain-containing protein [Mycena venus]